MNNIILKQDSQHLQIKPKDIESNFDLSIVMPFYKKMAEFRKVFPRNYSFFARNGIEVVLVLDSTDEKEVLIDFVKEYPSINWKIICNYKPHDWRNPSKPLNVGIKNATKKYIMVCSPESEFLTDVIYILRNALEFYPGCFTLGRVCFASEDEIIEEQNIDSFLTVPYGSIMVEKKYIFDIRGYDETLQKWGGDDDNLRARLEMIGVKKIFMDEAIFIHRDHNYSENKKGRSQKLKNMPDSAKRHFLFPDSPICNGVDWGTDFNEIIYDWKNNVYAEEQLKKYIKKYTRYSYKEHSCGNEYPLILLFQTYNEENYIIPFLKHISRYFDAIIMLDDGSLDETYELACNDKIVLKIKKNRTDFNDLQNRNILLEAVSFFKYELACFMDVDEIIDNRFSDLRAYISDTKFNSYQLNYIHLWDNDKTYNAEYPYTNNGIGYRYKIFRNIGYSKIISKCGKLHFQQVPTIIDSKIIPVLVKHYGNLTREQRINKYLFYKDEDTDNSQDSYEHLLNDTPLLKSVFEITKKDLIEKTI